MKKTLVSILRLAVLVGVLVLLPHLERALKAQAGGGNCQNFGQTSYDFCPSCCTEKASSKGIPEAPFSSGNGTQSLQDQSWSCGTPQAGCASACSGDAPVAISDGSCCIAQGGTGCSTGSGGEPCCPGNTCTNGTCVATSGGCPQCPRQKVCVSGCSSPILLDIDGQGFSLTSAENGVVFDISGGGTPEQIGWTARGADNAFLALPGADGLVHNGTELFGNYTPQPPSDHPNGFLALAVYDLPANGGNDDGIIDYRDVIFSHLRLWIDRNHDGICQSDEMHTLPSLGVNSISLKYRSDDKADQYGNIFRYRAQLNPDKATDAGKTAYDIFFVTLDTPNQGQ
jgi:hypothetical protein